MDTQDFFKKSKIYKIVQNDVNNQTINHSYLLQSLDIELINDYASFVAQTIFCEKKQFCGQCLSCQKVLHHNHSDIIEYPKNVRLSVEESRQICENSYVLPFENDKKIYIIRNFDLSTIQAQNALLKVLEEPPKHVIFILTVQNINNVVATIRSRSKIISEPNLKVSDIENFLKDISSNMTNNEIIAGLSDGQITNARHLINDKNAIDISHLCYEIFTEMQKSSDVLIFSTKVLKYKKDLEFFLNCMMRVVNLIDIYSVEQKEISNYDKKYLEKIYGDYNAKMLSGIASAVLSAKEKLTFNCNITSVVDKLLLDILEVKYLCQKQ